MKVLLVEDQDSEAEEIIADLEAQGHEVVRCSNYNDSLVWAMENGLPDLVLLDRQLPLNSDALEEGSDVNMGFEIASSLARKKEMGSVKWEDAKVVIWTRDPDDEFREKAAEFKEKGLVDYWFENKSVANLADILVPLVAASNNELATSAENKTIVDVEIVRDFNYLGVKFLKLHTLRSDEFGSSVSDAFDGYVDRLSDELKDSPLGDPLDLAMRRRGDPELSAAEAAHLDEARRLATTGSVHEIGVEINSRSNDYVMFGPQGFMQGGVEFDVQSLKELGKCLEGLFTPEALEKYEAIVAEVGFASSQPADGHVVEEDNRLPAAKRALGGGQKDDEPQMRFR